ncbi:MAG: DNA translocase FtsK [Bacteroidales bacterium]|nr:DNA translocase FtsK [Clostridium sp.]MCM1203107.1 DNA translocase FtsK [Bacteroidales bacterium]
MAGSKNNRKTSYQKNTGKDSRNTKSTKKKSPAGGKAKAREVEEASYAPEIAVWIICAVMLILELGNFGLCGFINTVSDFFFGVFGIIEYIMPAAVAFAAFFLHINEYKKRAVHKVIFGAGVLLCFGMIGQMAAGIEEYRFVELFKNGFAHKGGGIVCGSVAYLLDSVVGTAGTYIILALAIILCVVLFAEISVIDLIKDLAALPAEMRADEFEEEAEVNVKRTARRKAPASAAIVKEDYSKKRDEIFTERKSPSVLDRISVLPPDADKGILPSSAEEKRPQHEDVIEITMEYELPLPGEGMEDIAITETPKEDIKRDAGKTKRRSRGKKNIVPEVLEEQSPVTGKKQETNLETEKQSMNLEDKTVPEQKNVSAKEVGKSDAEYRFPPIGLLRRGKAQAAAKEEVIRQNAIKLQEVLKSFGVNVTMTNYSCGPSVTRYEMVPEQGVKVSKITGLADDIMMNLAAQSIRIEAPIPGKSAVGIEIPNSVRSGVGFRELIDTEKFIKHPSKIAFAVGKDIEGNVIVEDIAKMPHLLIAGATGSGKSVCTNTLIMSILYKARPDEVKLILVDPKQVELKVYNGIPHLLTPVVTDPKKAAGALNWAVAEMTKRYQLFSECNVRNIQGYNARVKEVEESGKLSEENLEKMPQIVIIVDELADLMMVAKAEVEEAIVRLAQLARAAGIHLVIATQRPSVDVVTGLIKANVPSRIALSVSSGVDSRTIIDSVGAEKLLGNGDMLFYPTMYPKPLRVQGAYISDDEVISVVEFLKAQNGETAYSEEMTNQITASAGLGGTDTGKESGTGNDRDEYFVQAGKFIIEKDKASIGMLQRMFKIGFNRAARIMDQLYEAGVVGPEEGTKPRQVLMSEEQFEAYVDEYF